MSSTAPRVDVVVAIHDATRPLQRVVESLQQSGLEIGSELRITAVCHNIGASEVTARLSEAARSAVRFLELADGIHSAAGPFNLGISRATADYVSIMGSDDYLEPGALAAWLARADRGRYTAVVAPQRYATGSPVRTPPIRPRRAGVLDGVKDRLAYRTAPLGLIRRDAIARLGLELTPAMSTGEDQAFSTRLWFSGEPIVYAIGDPRYVVGDDARNRVTTTPRTLADELSALSALIASEWFRDASEVTRRTIATRIARVQVFSAAMTRSSGRSWTDADRGFMANFLTRLGRAAPGYARPLSIADRRLLDALAEPTTPESVVGRLATARRAFGHPTTILTRDPRGLFAVDGPLRFMVASALL